MSSDRKTATKRDTLDSNRGQVIFIVVGLAIVLGGLWLLYSAEGPYHPDGDRQVQLSF